MRSRRAWAQAEARDFPQPQDWDLAAISAPDASGEHRVLIQLLRDCSERSLALSVQIGRRLFNHVGSVDRLVWQ